MPQFPHTVPRCPEGMAAPTAMAEFLREAVGVEGRELSEELALNSSELRLSEASLRPLLMELLSSQLQWHSQRHPPARPFPTTHRLRSTPGLQPQPRQPGREPTLGSHRWLQPSLAEPSNPAISPLRPQRDVLWTRQHGGPPPAPGLAPSPLQAVPPRGSGGFPERAGTQHGAHHPSTLQPPPFLGCPAPAGTQHLRVPQQLLRAEGAAERAQAHLQGCHSAWASSSRVSTAPFRSTAQ